LVDRVAEDMAASLIGGRHSGAPRVGVSIGNPRGQKAACYCQETHFPTDLGLGALVYRLGGLTPPSRRCTLLPDATEDGVSRPPHGAPPPLDVRGSSTRWDSRKRLPSAVRAREDRRWGEGRGAP
jgi:hypothetical protein